MGRIKEQWQDVGATVVSSETRFATSHSGFWKAILPMGEPYIRSKNAQPGHFTKSVYSIDPADNRGVVNECAFLLFAEGIRQSKRPTSLSNELVEDVFQKSQRYVARLRQGTTLIQPEATKGAKIEARLIAENLHEYFVNEGADVIVKPLFPGCGWVNEAEGDVLSGPTLYEVKAGDRHFRLSDLRQLLCYCALDFSSKTHGITSVSLINPRAGTIIREDLDVLSRKVSGISSAELLGEIVNYISESQFLDRGV
jgi:hypothetical protein